MRMTRTSAVARHDSATTIAAKTSAMFSYERKMIGPLMRPRPCSTVLRYPCWVKTESQRIPAARSDMASANGSASSRHRRALILPTATELLHLTGTARGAVRTPAFRARVGHGLLKQRGLLAQHRLDVLVLDDDALERVDHRLVEVAALRSEPHRQRHRLRVLRRRLLGHSVGLELETRIEVARDVDLHDGEEAVLTQRGDLRARLQEVIDQRLRAFLVRRRLRDAQPDEYGHEVPALRARGRGHGHEVVRLRLEHVDEPRGVVEADPDLFGLQRVLHEGIRGGLRIRVLPQVLDRLPHRLGVSALVSGHETAGVRR